MMAKGTKKVLKLFLGIIALVAAFLLIYVFLGTPGKKQDTEGEMLSAVRSVREVLRVTSVEGTRVVPVTYKGRNGTNAFAVGHYRYRISYDIDSVKSYRSGDSLLIVRLPQETVRILEDEKEGFRVLDVWGTGFLGNLFGTSLKTEDENKMKQMATNRLRQLLETDGTISKARDAALSTVGEMFALSVIGGRVIVLPPLDPGQKIDPIVSEKSAVPILLSKEYEVKK